MIIFLNGCSSSGKSSIAKALQHLSEKPLLHLGVDTFFDMLPSDYVVFGTKAEEGIRFVPDHDEGGHPLMRIESGSFGKQVMHAGRLAIKVMGDQGLDLILDEVLLEDDELKDYVKTLEGHKVYLIGVQCSLEMLEERERLRGNRSIGLARAQISHVHGPTRFYDLEVDTTHTSQVCCAKDILHFIEAHPKPTSFDKLRESFAS